MAERLISQGWVMRAVYVGMALVIIFGRLLPLENTIGPWLSPDLLVAMTFAWALRRPDYVPALIVAAVLLLADFLLLRPPGLMAVLVLVGTIVLQRRQRDIREMGFLLEWLTVAVALIAILAAERLILGILVVPQAFLGQSLMQAVVTAVFYPLVVLVSETLFGVRRIAHGELAGLGQRS